jgi:hypothetical protein
MITIFSIPKPFKDHIKVIQRNAIKSWTLLPGIEVILFGDDEGTALIATEFSVNHVPDVARNEYGTPLLSDMFARAQQMAANDIICYVNCDIILMSDFVAAVQKIASLKKRFLMVGRRWNVDITEPLDFGQGWEDRLRARVRRTGELYTPSGIDYFVFPRNMLGEMPPFAVGRPTWDNWTIYRARSLRASVVDATKAIMCVHQNHNYKHMANVDNRFGQGPEAVKNFSLCGGWDHFYTLYDANWIFDGVKLQLALANRFREPKFKAKRVYLSLLRKYRNH